MEYQEVFGAQDFSSELPNKAACLLWPRITMVIGHLTMEAEAPVSKLWSASSAHVAVGFVANMNFKGQGLILSSVTWTWWQNCHTRRSLFRVIAHRRTGRNKEGLRNFARLHQLSKFLDNGQGTVLMCPLGQHASVALPQGLPYLWRHLLGEAGIKEQKPGIKKKT